MDLNEIDKDVSALENLQFTLHSASQHETAEEAIAMQIRQAKQKAGYSIDGEDFTPPGVDERLSEKYRLQYDAVVREQAQLLRTLDYQVERKLAAMETALQTLPSETDLLADGALEGPRQQATMTEALADQAARAQLAGLSARSVLAIYQTLSDVRDRAKVRLIEAEARNGFPTLKLAHEADHSERVTQLVVAVQERRKGRVPAEVQALQHRRANVMNIRTYLLVRHLLDKQRGVAKLSKPRRMVGA